MIDQKTLFHDNADVSASGNNYSSNVVELPIGQDKSGFTQIECVITGAFGGAGDIEIEIVGSDTVALPVTVVQPVFHGSASLLTAGKTIRISISPDSLKKYNRVNVKNSAAAAGAMITSYLN